MNWWARSACRWPNPRSSTLPESTCWRLSASTGPGRRTGAFASAAGGLLSGPIGAARSPCIKRRTSAISMKVSAFSNWPELATAVRETGAERKTAPSEFCTIELDLGGRRAFRHLDLIVEATTPGPADSPGGGGNHWLTMAAPSNLQPRCNICPTDTIDVVASGGGERTLVPMRWGLVPGRWKKPLKEITVATFNARSDTIADKPMFRESFKRRRCLIPASGYYEWVTTPEGKQPYYFSRWDGQVITIAGVQDGWTDLRPGSACASVRW